MDTQQSDHQHFSKPVLQERSVQAYVERQRLVIASEENANPKPYIIYSLGAHIGLLLMFVLGLGLSSALPVFENTNQNDVISAVVLGDTEKSKILTEQAVPPPPAAAPQPKEAAPPEPKTKPQEVKKDVIALKPEKKIAPPKPKFFAKDLLADIKKVNDQKTKVKQKQLQKQFEKTLREQAEKSLRQQLLNEEIKLKGTQARYSHGVVDKYKALIIQAISEHWLVPTQSKKDLTSQLMIRLAPGGQVLDVQVTRSSGDLALDSSARAAVLKASPLPVPSNPDDFEPFRQFVLKVKPENIIGNDYGMNN